MSKARFIVVCCASALIGGVAHAQQGTPPTAPGTPAATGEVEEVIVTARKVSENVQSVPVAITALSGAALANALIGTTADLQSEVPNLFLQKSSNDPQGLYVSIRGQVQNDLPLTVDPSVGIYINNFYVPRTYGMDNALVDLDRVEVLRGPQGTLYGRNTTGGAISFYTKDPTDQFGASVDVTGGNYDYGNIVGILNAPLGDDVGLRLVAQHGEHDAYGHDALGQDLDNSQNSYVRAKLKAKLGSSITTTLWADYANDRTGPSIVKFAGLSQGGGGLPPGGVVTIEAAAENGSLPPSPAAIGAAIAQLESYTHDRGGNFYNTYGTTPGFSSSTSEKVGFDLEADLGSGITLRSLTGYQHLDSNRSGDLDGTPFNILAFALGTYDRYISQEFQLLGGSEQLNWVAGLYGGDERGKEYSGNIILPDINPGNPSQLDAFVRNSTAAAFAQANWEFIDDWRLTGGFRYSSDWREINSVNTTGPDHTCIVPAPGVESTPPGASQCPREFKADFSKPSWLVSIDHQFTPDILGYAKVSHGYRSGGLNYRGGNEIETFAAFQPETVTEYEGGVKTELFDRRLRFNFAAYHDNYDNIQRSVGVLTPGGTPATIVTNAAKAQIDGFEAEETLRIGSFVTLNSSVGLTDARYKTFVDVTGDRSHEAFPVPRWTASVGPRVVQPTALGEASLQATFHWQSTLLLAPNVPSLDQVTQKGYGLLDLRATLDIDNLGMQIALFGKNVAAKHYLVSSPGLENSLGYNYVVTGDPRTFGVEFIKRFGGI